MCHDDRTTDYDTAGLQPPREGERFNHLQFLHNLVRENSSSHGSWKSSLPCHFQVVLIGDPKQLRPIVKNMRVKKLGMSRSLFERYFQQHNKRVVMLDTQYRMVSILSLPLSRPLSHVALPSLISLPLNHVVPPCLTSSPFVFPFYRAERSEIYFSNIGRTR